MIILLTILFFLIFFVPWSIHFNINITCNRFFLDIKKISGLKNNIVIKVCSFFPIYSKSLFGKKKKKKNKKKTFFKKSIIINLFEKCYVEKFGLFLGFNVKDVILNSKINALLNTLLCIAINYNANNFNFKNLYYQTYISDSLIKLNFDCIIKISLVNTIRVIANKWIEELKQKKKSVEMNERSIYGRTSN